MIGAGRETRCDRLARRVIVCTHQRQGQSLSAKCYEHRIAEFALVRIVGRQIGEQIFELFGELNFGSLFLLKLAHGQLLGVILRRGPESDRADHDT